MHNRLQRNFVLIKKAKLQMSLNCDLLISAETSKHQCSDCEYALDAEAYSIFDELSNVESSISEKVKIYLPR